jgi:hypothetical protein
LIGILKGLDGAGYFQEELMQYEIWYAKSPMAMIYPHADTDTLESTHERGEPIEADNLEDCYLKGQNRRVGRSIAVGDVIQVGLYDHLVMPIGFKTLK